MSQRTPLGRVLGLGSAKEGVGHWWTQRTSAVALIPLCLWFAISLVTLASRTNLDYATVTGWIGAPTHAVLLLLLLATSCYHSLLGVQVVIEDYVEPEWVKIASLLLSKFVHALLATVGMYAILRIAFTGAQA